MMGGSTHLPACKSDRFSSHRRVETELRCRTVSLDSTEISPRYQRLASATSHRESCASTERVFSSWYCIDRIARQFCPLQLCLSLQTARYRLDQGSPRFR